MAGNNGVHRGPNKDKPFRDALRMEIAAAGEDLKALRRVAHALIEKAASGDVPAIKELGDRLDGKVAQPVGGDDELGPVKTILEVTWGGQTPLLPIYRTSQDQSSGRSMNGQHAGPQSSLIAVPEKQ